MNLFYEEQGEFKVGTILADQDTSLQVETASGRRTKVKAANVLLRFAAPAASGFMAAAEQAAAAIDIDFLWQCCGAEEFGFERLAQDYYGRAPGAVESAGLLLALHGAPMYFYRKGRGRFKAAPEESLRAALASVERKKREAELRQSMVDALVAGRMPAEMVPLRDRLLYQPDRNTLEAKALEEACETLRLTPAKVFERAGALPAPQDYHLNRFLFEHFPKGIAFPAVTAPEPPADLPLADAPAYSIDDSATTEIDDAFSLVPRVGGYRLGIHIAAPALGVLPGSPLDEIARERLSTVYMPGNKITMLPQAAIEHYTLAAGREVPAVSLYLDLEPDLAIAGARTCVERVRVAENLRHETLDPVFNEASVRARRVEHPFGAELLMLHDLALRLEAQRGRQDAQREWRTEYSFRVEGERIEITERRRGAPMDKVVAELMILVNSEWGRQLDARGWPAVFRAQQDGRVKLSTVASPHQGLGVDQYIWASSPLRRYVDLLNQRQLIAAARDLPPVYARGDESLFAAMRAFEVATEAYTDIQRTMERYWCLRWIVQEAVATLSATVIRENLMRLERLPMVLRVPSAPDLPAGTRVELDVSTVDPLELVLECEFRQRLAA